MHLEETSFFSSHSINSPKKQRPYNFFKCLYSLYCFLYPIFQQQRNKNIQESEFEH